MIETIIDKNKCTACGLCVDQCPSKCITFQEDEYGSVFPVVDKNKCLNCKRCTKVCPALNLKDDSLSDIKQAFVAWNKDKDTRMLSASGGAASGFYHYALSHNWAAVGAKFDNENNVRLSVFSRDTFDEGFRNSKYVYANPSNVYSEVLELLKRKTPVLFIGLPCQVAAMKSIAAEKHCEGLLTTVDLICHGVAPQKYLEQHIERCRKNCSFDNVYFRDPRYGTSNFFFSLYRRNKCVYKKRVRSSDTYQTGYHSALIYRDNCYECQYAKAKRCGDITIGDFSGLGSVKPYSGERINISCVMLNTENGMQFWDAASSLFMYQSRPIEEALKDKQLQHPSIKSSEHNLFLAAYKDFNDFDRAVRKAIPKTIFCNFIYEILKIDAIKNVLRKVKKRLLNE